MWAIFKKEFFSFFSSALGVLVVVVFLIITGLMLWVFDTPFNIFNASYADLTLFFELAPWVFLFLIPGICMRSFSEEQRKGTLELLLTKPITLQELVFGKFLGALLLSVIAILPTLIYVFCLSDLTDFPTNIDYGAIFASYFGLLFLVAVYTSMGVFSSSLTNNQLIAFIIGIVLCLTMYYGFFGLSESGIFGNDVFILEYLSLKYHYSGIMRGVIDTRALIYFVSVWILFLFLTQRRLKHLKA